MRQKKPKVTKPSGFAEEGQAPLVPPAFPMHEAVELGAGGRLVIPAKMRAALGMKIGDRLHVRLEENELRIFTFKEGRRKAQEIVRKHMPGNGHEVDDFLARKREEAAREWADLLSDYKGE
jgi:AbrB family looped-hinge helix DNA binding protein